MHIRKGREDWEEEEDGEETTCPFIIDPLSFPSLSSICERERRGGRISTSSFTNCTEKEKPPLISPPVIGLANFDTVLLLYVLPQVFIKSELKVGVMYVREDQCSEEAILANNDHGSRFEEFLTILGEKVRLKGFDRYKGGLDTVHDLTGTHSVFTHWRGIEIMFHVSTLLPFEQNDPQKVSFKLEVHLQKKELVA